MAAAGDPEGQAVEYARFLLGDDSGRRLGLAPAERGSDALVAVGWAGPANYTGGTGEIAAMVRSWEGCFGAWVVGVGFGDLHLSVGAPPALLVGLKPRTSGATSGRR